MMMAFVLKLRSLVGTLLVVCFAATAWAHPEDESVTPANVWRAWTWEPFVVGVMLLSAILYFRGVAQLWRRAEPERTFARRQGASFCAALAVLATALLSPVHALGEELFSVHMVQHELLMIIAAPLLVLARPLVPMLMAFPPRTRVKIVDWTRAPRFRSAWHALTNPLTAWTLHGIALWAWHLPYLYEATLDSEWMHALQHMCFLGTALLFWWTLFHGRYGRMGYGAAVLYVFTTTLHTGVLGALFTFSTRLWYPAYQGRTTAWGITALQDQQLGGLIMWIPAGVVLIGVGLGFLAAMLGESERRASHSTLAMTRVSAPEECDERSCADPSHVRRTPFGRLR